MSLTLIRHCTDGYKCSVFAANAAAAAADARKRISCHPVGCFLRRRAGLPVLFTKTEEQRFLAQSAYNEIHLMCYSTYTVVSKVSIDHLG